MVTAANRFRWTDDFRLTGLQAFQALRAL
ncbi:unnamed protein product, partial [Rotaria sp. Silwood1]